VPVHVVWAESPADTLTVAKDAAEAKPGPNPGKGWRLLGPNEIVAAGDEWQGSGPVFWRLATGSIGKQANALGFTYRRRVKTELAGEGYYIVPLGEFIKKGDEWLFDGEWIRTGLTGDMYKHSDPSSILRRAIPGHNELATTTHRPYKNAQEAAEHLQGRLVYMQGSWWAVTRVTNSGVYIGEDTNLPWSFKNLLKHGTFTDGTPCGVRTTKKGTK
jgi:hypothetical protein